ncbi:MAG TPA: PEGA domain-containing protein [Nannocystis exedens]|nr:PEGA domain-containing protein [Nannocystis exedens]
MGSSGPVEQPAQVDSDAETHVRGDRVAVTDGIKIRGREDADIIQPRTVSPSGRIQKRPSVIIKRGTPIERFVPPPPAAKKQPRSEFSSDDLQRSEEERSGPPLGLIIGVAAVVAMALTVSIWRYWIRDSKSTDSAGTAAVHRTQAEDYVRLRFESSPIGAEVLHSGEKAIGRTPVDFQVPRGAEGILFVFRLPGHVDVVKTVLPDQTKTVRADLNPVPVGEPFAPASDPPNQPLVDEMAPEHSASQEPFEPVPKKPKQKPTAGKKSAGTKHKDPPAGATKGATKGADAKPETPGDKPPVEDPEPMGDLDELKNPFAP